MSTTEFHATMVVAQAEGESRKFLIEGLASTIAGIYDRDESLWVAIRKLLGASSGFIEGTKDTDDLIVRGTRTGSHRLHAAYGQAEFWLAILQGSWL